MVKALSFDLRTRALAAVAEGASHRAAAARFGVSAASVSRWRALARERGDARPGTLGGDRRSGRIEAQAPPIHERLGATSELTIEELLRTLAERGHAFGYGTIQRFFPAPRDHASKKDGPRERAGPSRRPEATTSLVRRSDRSRAGAPGLHRWFGGSDIDPVDRCPDGRGQDQPGTHARPLPPRRAPAHGLPVRPLEDDDLRCRPFHAWHDRALRPPWPHERA